MIFFDNKFAEIDSTLRSGGHINLTDFITYNWLCEHQNDISLFYLNYRATLIHHPDEFFFLLIKEDLIRSRVLSKSCMHLGMLIALKSRDPEIVRSLGWLSAHDLIQDISTSIPRPVVKAIYAPKHKESNVDKHIIEEVRRALRLLQKLNFIEINKNNQVRPLRAINRFAEIAKHGNDPDELAKIFLSEQRGITDFSVGKQAYGDDDVSEN